ncbi:MAG: peptidase T, partial [Treponema sp.]|nr:peptidase T [Treponema sp.]
MQDASTYIAQSPISKPLLERFLRYVKTYSESSSEDADKGIQPSTPQQKEMAALLNSELEDAGFK